ncbi:MAG TPA: glutamate carboxypeptidase [Janthinobacterium sp.]|nr:glutamate carboxypeptidase [Janthinobacterium sp.]
MPKRLIPALLFGAACCLSGAAAAQADQALLAAAQKSRPDFVRDLAALVNIDSGTDDGAGLEKVGDFLVRRLERLGASVEILAAPPSAGKTIVGTLQGSGTKKLMLMIHYDTVFGAGEAARRPFKTEGNKAFGPGVADAKGGALMILAALDIVHERAFKNYGTLTVVFNPDEEKSSLGSRETIRTLSAAQDDVLIFEPPDAEKVIVATNGIAYVHLDVKGLASHAGSAPEKGRNAAVELASQIVQLKDLGSAAKGTTVNWTMIQAGERANVIPDKASATADMRMSDLGEIARVQHDANDIVRRQLIPGTEVSVTVENRRPPFSRNPASDRLGALAGQIYAELGKTIAPVAMRYGTDAGFAYHPENSKPAVLDGLGIVGDRLHSPDEWADLDSIVPRLYLTVRMLEALTGPGAR